MNEGDKPILGTRLGQMMAMVRRLTKKWDTLLAKEHLDSEEIGEAMVAESVRESNRLAEMCEEDDDNG